FCNEEMHAFVANNLTFVGQDLDENEKIIVEPVTWRNAVVMACDGTIVDGKTLATLLFYRAYFK
ncbi:MAG: NUDIX hydrolase, partial [Parachlamydia sp.]|nr:NUDIX hydrolase [Parachlamydia sp.]